MGKISFEFVIKMFYNKNLNTMRSSAENQPQKVLDGMAQTNG